MQNQPGWAVEVNGEKIDLDDLQKRLPAPFDPWIEQFARCDEQKLVLRSHAWKRLNSAEEVHMDAARILERLHGQALLYDAEATRLTPGGVCQFDVDGKAHRTIIANTGKFNITLGRVRLRATGSTGNSSSPPAETETQKWFRQAEDDENRGELLIHLSRAKDWYDVYKVMELIRKTAGGSNGFKRLLGNDQREWERIWRTANCKRHAPDPIKYPLPDPPADFNEAWRYVLCKAKDII